MAGWRNSQRGHASVPDGLPKWVISRLIWPKTFAALAAVVAVVAMAGTLLEDQSDGSGLLGSLKQALFSAAPATAAPTQGLLDDPISRVQDALSRASGDTQASGLQTRPLSGEALQESLPLMGKAEARLIGIYKLISEARHREALREADALVRDHPNFHLAHLVHGDLLSLQTRQIRQLGDVPDTKALAAADQLKVLREESRRRLRALTERPPEGSVPSQFLALASQSEHAIAIDASRSRLYLFENQPPAPVGSLLAPPPRLKLIADFYISVGLSGIEKQAEGDKKTPLGVYYITSTLSPASLPDLYGVGALPINYPNALDVQRGKTGSGIWLHGTPREQFVRAPLASDGCVVLSNPDLERLLKTVRIRTTPVVIAPELQWVQPDMLDNDRRSFEASLERWRQAKSQGDMNALRTLYSNEFQPQGRDFAQWWSRLEGEARSGRSGRELQLKDVSVLRWKDKDDTMVVTFGEVASGSSRGVQRRQYWLRERDQWRIFAEGAP